MSFLARCFFAFGAAVPCLFHVSSASACGSLPCAQLDDVQPADGSSGVALNTELRVLFFGSLEPYSEDGSCNADVQNIRLVPSAGDAIPLQGKLHERASAEETWVVAKLDRPLAASTAYALQLELGPGEDACRCDEREWVTVSSFTTGNEEDRAAPAFAGVTALTYGARARGDSTCGTMDGFPAFAELTGLSDDFPEPRYNIYVNGELARRYVEALTSGDWSELYVDCGSSSLSRWTMLQPGDDVEVRAVDLSGNESTPNEPIGIGASCDSTDASVNDSVNPDSPLIDVIRVPENEDGTLLAAGDQASSCALYRRVAGAPSAAFYALLLLLGWRRARR